MPIKNKSDLPSMIIVYVFMFMPMQRLCYFGRLKCESLWRQGLLLSSWLGATPVSLPENLRFPNRYGKLRTETEAVSKLIRQFQNRNGNFQNRYNFSFDDNPHMKFCCQMNKILIDRIKPKAIFFESLKISSK